MAEQGTSTPKTENPVLVEAEVRGDYAHFAAQLRGGTTSRWRQADVDAALPIIDRWAQAANQQERGTSA